MFAALTGAYNGLKQAATLAKTFNDLKTAAEIAGKTIELNQIIAAVQNDLFDAQSAYAAAVGRINDLEKQLVQMKDWAAEKQRYELHELVAGSFVYRLKSEMAGGEPVHHLCTHCYEQGIKSILQFSGYESAFHKYSCPSCQSFVLGERLKSSIEVVESRSRWDDY